MQAIPLKTIRAVAAEVLAYTILELFPGAQLISGKATDLGFYYDFHLTQNVTEEMLPLIEEHMRGVIKEQIAVETLDMMRENAMELFRHQKQPYKAIQLEDFPENIVQICKMGNFYDVSPLFSSDTGTGIVQAFKLQQIQQKTARLPFYDKKGKKDYEETGVVRITGTACADKKELKDFLKKLEALKPFDVQVLGAEMELFLQEEGLLWLPNGQFLRESLINFLKDEEKKLKIESVSTPFGSQKSTLHARLYRSKIREEKELPLRYSEISETFQDEPDGLFKTKTFLSDTAHIFCPDKEVVAELISCLQLIDKTVKILGLTYVYVVNAHKPKGKGFSSRISWKDSVTWLETALNELNFQFVVDKVGINRYISESSEDGPTIEVEITDALGRKWQSSSLGINLKLPELSGLYYLDPEGRKQAPVMICRKVFNSLEQFMALLLEGHHGVLPLKFVKQQVIVLPIAERNVRYAKGIEEKLSRLSLRASVDDSLQKLGEKIHRAEKKKIPFMLIVGDNEEKGGTVTVRACMQDVDRAGVELDSFLKQIL